MTILFAHYFYISIKFTNLKAIVAKPKKILQNKQNMPILNILFNMDQCCNKVLNKMF